MELLPPTLEKDVLRCTKLKEKKEKLTKRKNNLFNHMRYLGSRSRTSVTLLTKSKMNTTKRDKTPRQKTH